MSQLLTQQSYICWLLSCSKSLLGVQYLCIQFVYLSAERAQLTERRHLDANAVLSLTAPADVGEGSEAQTDKLRQGLTARRNKWRARPDVWICLCLWRCCAFSLNREACCFVSEPFCWAPDYTCVDCQQGLICFIRCFMVTMCALCFVAVLSIWLVWVGLSGLKFC